MRHNHAKCPFSPSPAATEGFIGDKERVHLVFGGRALDDLKQLRDYGVVEDSVLAHVLSQPGVSFEAPAERVDYAGLAELLSQAHAASLGGRRGDPADFSAAGGGAWDPTWGRGSAWEVFPPVVVGGTGVSRDEVIEDEDSYGAY